MNNPGKTFYIAYSIPQLTPLFRSIIAQNQEKISSLILAVRQASSSESLQNVGNGLDEVQARQRRRKVIDNYKT